MDDLPKLGEKLVIVNDFAKKALVMISTVKSVYNTDGQRPLVLADTNLQTVYKALLKKFPEHAIGQVQGSTSFDTTHKVFVDTLFDAYEALVAMVELRDAALHVFNDCNRLVALSLDLNPEVTYLFLRLLTAYARANLLMGMFQDRKLVATVYAKSFQTANGTPESNYGRVAKYLAEFENPVDKLQEELATISGRVGQVLTSLKPNFDRAYPATDSLFNEGPLNTMHAANLVCKPSEEGKRLGDLGKPNELAEWIIFGLLVCPAELAKPTGVELLKSALLKGGFCELYRDELMNVHQDFDQMFATSKANIKGAKAVLGDTSTAMVTSSPGYHNDRRDFLRLQLYQTCELLREKPSLVVPKLSMVLASLGMARDEILWYFRNTEKQPPKTAKNKYKDEDNKDILITELLFLVGEIKKQVLSQKAAIRQYYLEYLNGYYRTKVLQLVEQASQTQRFDDRMKAHFDVLIDTLAKLNPNQASVDFEPLRLNWVRLQVFFSLPTSTIAPAAITPLVSLLSEIAGRTKYVDRLEEQVEAFAGLEALYFERAAFNGAFALAQKHVAQSKYAGAYIAIARTFLNNVSPYYPREMSQIGPKATSILDGMYSEVTKRIADLLNDAALAVRDFAIRSEPDQGLIAVAKDREARERNRKSGVTTEIENTLPGTESVMRATTEIKKLNARKQLAKNLAVAITSEEMVTFFDTQFYPCQFLLDAIYNRLRAFIVSTCKIDATPEDPNPVFPVKRPSLALAEIEAYIFSTLTVELAVDVGVPAIIREALLDQTDLEAARKLTKSNQTDAAAAASKVKAKKSDMSRILSSAQDAPLLFTYLKWYIEFVLQQAMAGNLLYSPLRKSFVSRASTGLKIERFASLSELMCLCRLVGPNGLKYIEERLMRLVASVVGEIKEMILLNSEVLNGIRDNWQSEARCNELIKRLKNHEGLYSRVISLGVIFAFRSLFAEALSRVMSDKVDHLYSCIANAHKQYPANTYGVAGYAVIDSVANWAGIFDNVDAALRNCVEVHCHDPAIDRRVWDLLPYLLGVAFPTLANQDNSFFNINIGNCENNALCVALALNKITEAVMSLVSTSAEPDIITNTQKTFLEVAATALLRLRKENAKELDSVVVILVEFAESSKFLALSDFDDHCPYSYVRTAFSEAFRKRGRRKGGKEDDL